MKVYECIFFLTIMDSVIGLRGRKCFYPYNRFAKFRKPFQISYHYQKNEYDLPTNTFGVNSILDGQSDILEPRFRNGAANISPLKVSCESQNITSAMKQLRSQIKCIPRDGIVDLKAPIGFVVSPNAVMVKKCGGMCNGAMNCISKTTKEKMFYVRSQNLETNDVMCSSILVPEDTSCKCGCETKETDCLPTQKYDKTMCNCKCINMTEYDNCIQKSHMNFRWDEKTCRCICGITKICTTGSDWVPSKCRCAKINE